MNQSKYIFVKSGHMTYKTDEFRATGDAFSKIVDVQGKMFTTVSLYTL